MRRFILALCLAILQSSAVAAPAAPTGPEKVTVAQLEKVLVAAQGKPDAEAAQQLAGMELTQRLNSAKLAHLQAAMPGEKARQALLALADESAFLDPPAEEVPANPAPDPATQRQIIALVVNYVTKTIHQLPNFLATRETTRFEDRPQQDVQQSTGVVSYGYQPLHFAGKSSAGVVYRDGQEVVDTGTGKLKKLEPGAQGLVSYGEFGPILSTVLLDAAQSKLEWSHWETGAGGPEAVFRYQVPAQKSNYWVQFCCVSDRTTPGAEQPFRERAGYHGEMAVDPATGNILRVTLEADLALGEPLTRAAMMVEYGSVEIGGKTFVCPTRSVALSLMHFAAASGGMHSAALDQGPIKTLVNDVAFEQYHRLGSETRILTGENEIPAK